MKPVILVVDDDEPIVTILRYNLENEGFTVVEARDGEEALLMLEEHPVDLVLLDLMLPYVSGTEICRRLRLKPETKNLPVIMVTARAEDSDRIRGLNVGADDYITKPFSVDELIARIHAVLRRLRPALEAEILSIGDLEMDLTTHRVTRDGRTIHLSPTQFRLLRFLMEHPDRVFSRDQLIDRVWGNNIHVLSRTVDVHIRRLREALNVNGDEDLIRTVRATGYALRKPAGENAAPESASEA